MSSRRQINTNRELNSIRDNASKVYSVKENIENIRAKKEGYTSFTEAWKETIESKLTSTLT